MKDTKTMELCRDVTDEEIKVAMWSIGYGKALGIDGFKSYFFQKILGHSGKRGHRGHQGVFSLLVNC